MVHGPITEVVYRGAFLEAHAGVGEAQEVRQGDRSEAGGHRLFGRHADPR